MDDHQTIEQEIAHALEEGTPQDMAKALIRAELCVKAFRRIYDASTDPSTVPQSEVDDLWIWIEETTGWE